MIIKIQLDKIKPNPWQTRLADPDLEYIRDLSKDIAANGLLQIPIGRCKSLSGDILDLPQFGYEQYLESDNAIVQLAFGHNRLAAYRLLSIGATENTLNDYLTMPVDIRILNDEQMATLAWSENEKRRDVSPIERARAIEKRMADFGWNQTELAEHLGLNRSTVSNILRLLKLPEKMQAALASGEISERVASALLPMYELPAETIDLANHGWAVVQPEGVEADALIGVSSDVIRRNVESIYRGYTRPLQKAEFGLDEMFPENTKVHGYDYDGSDVTVYCGLCRSCDRRLKDQGNICIDVGCYTAKTVLRRRRYLAEASAASGFEVSDPDKGGRVTSLPYSDATASQILATHCENLCLVYSEEEHKNDLRHVSGFPHARIVCDKRNESCTCEKGLKLAASAPVPAPQPAYDYDPALDADETDLELEEEAISSAPVRAQTPQSVQSVQKSVDSPSAKDLEDIARQARLARRDVPIAYKELNDRLIALATGWLSGAEIGAIHVLSRRHCRMLGVDHQNIIKVAADQIAYTIIGNAGDHTSVAEMYERVNQNLTWLGLPPVSQTKTLVELFQEEEA